VLLGLDGAIQRIDDAGAAREVTRVNIDARLLGAGIFADGHGAVILGDGNSVWWNTRSEQHARTLTWLVPGQPPPTASEAPEFHLSHAPGTSIMALATYSRPVRILDADAGRLIWLSEGSLYCSPSISVAPDGRRTLVSCPNVTVAVPLRVEDQWTELCARLRTDPRWAAIANECR
jgi:hypothetical protein